MIRDFADHVLQELNDVRESKMQGLASGQLTYEKYQYHCGEIHGLDLAMDHIKAVLKKVEDANNE